MTARPHHPAHHCMRSPRLRIHPPSPPPDPPLHALAAGLRIQPPHCMRSPSFSIDSVYVGGGVEEIQSFPLTDTRKRQSVETTGSPLVPHTLVSAYSPSSPAGMELVSFRQERPKGIDDADLVLHVAKDMMRKDIEGGVASQEFSEEELKAYCHRRRVSPSRPSRTRSS